MSESDSPASFPKVTYQSPERKRSSACQRQARPCRVHGNPCPRRASGRPRLCAPEPEAPSLRLLQLPHARPSLKGEGAHRCGCSRRPRRRARRAAADRPPQRPRRARRLGSRRTCRRAAACRRRRCPGTLRCPGGAVTSALSAWPLLTVHRSSNDTSSIPQAGCPDIGSSSADH